MKLEIKQFGFLKDISIELDGILVIIGKQASGKSLIAKWVNFYFSLPFDIEQLMYEINPQTITSEGDWNKEIGSLIKRKFAQNFGNSANWSTIDICFNINNQDITLKSVNKDNKLSLTVFVPKTILATLFKAYTGFTLAKSVNSKSLAIKPIYNLLLSGKPDLKYFPAGRSAYEFILGTIGRAVIPALSNSFLFEEGTKEDQVNLRNANTINSNIVSEYINYCGYLKGLFAEGELTFDAASKSILNGAYTTKGDSEFIQNEGMANPTPLWLAATGQQEILRIIQDLSFINQTQEHCIRIYEEPEAHLWAQSVVDLSLMMFNQFSKTGFCVITTHSSLLMDALNLHLVEKTEGNSYKPVKYQVLHLADGNAHDILDHTTGFVNLEASFSLVNDNLQHKLFDAIK